MGIEALLTQKAPADDGHLQLRVDTATPANRGLSRIGVKVSGFRVSADNLVLGNYTKPRNFGEKSTRRAEIKRTSESIR